MDYHSMNRKELQALCKEHNIHANTTNAVMADKLSQLLNIQEKKKPSTGRRTCLKSSSETVDESDSAVTRRQTKKVRFSPDNELVEYELRSGRKEKALVTETKLRRESVAKKVDKPVVDSADIVESINDGGGVPVKLTRSRVPILQNDGVVPINEKKQGKRAVKGVEKESDAVKDGEANLDKATRLKVQTSGKGADVPLNEKKQGRREVKEVEKESEAAKETEVSRVKSTRSKAKTLMEDGMAPDVNPQVKKTRGREVAKDAENIEPSKMIVDMPVRVTRSRQQTLKDNIGNAVANPQAEKRRTRGETRVADQSNNSTLLSSHIASEDNQELPKRKSLRNREVKIADEDGGENLRHGRQKKRSKESITEVSEKQYHADESLGQTRRNEEKVEESKVSRVEVVTEGKITRSRAHIANKSSEGNCKSKTEAEVVGQGESKMVQQLEEPMKPAGRKNVNRRKSVMQPENTELVLQLEEPMNRPASKDARRKLVMKQAEEKSVDNPVVGKGKTVEETEMVESPNVPSRRSRRNTVLVQPDDPTINNFGTRKNAGRKQSKEQSGNVSTVHEGFEDKEHVTTSGKDISRNEMNAVASATGSHSSRKRRGDAIIEEQAIEIEYASPVDESPRRFTRSASKSEGKAVTHPPQKSQTLRMDKQSVVETAIVEGQQSGTGRALRSGVVRDNSSKKRAKLSSNPHGTKPPSDFEKVRAEKSRTEEASVSDFGSTEIDERVTETECTAIDESARRVTRSAIKSGRKAADSLFEKVDKKKQPSQSAIKGQPIENAPLSLPEVAESRPDTAVNETPRRFTRSAIKSDRNAVSRQFEKVDKKKLRCQSALKGQHTEDAQMSPLEVAEVKPDTDVVSSRGIKNSSSKKRKKSTMSVQKTIQTDTEGVRSETSKETKDQILVNLGDLSASESVRSQDNDVEKENKVSVSGTATVTENLKSLAISDEAFDATANALGKESMEVECIEKSSRRFTRNAAKCERKTTTSLPENLVNERQSSVDLPSFEDEIPSGINNYDIMKKPSSVSEIAETTSDGLLDGSHVQKQNEEVNVKSAILSEAEVQIAVNSVETSAAKSAIPEAYEKDMEMTKSGSRPASPQIDELGKEPEFSAGETVVIEESVDISLGVVTKGNGADADNNCDAVPYETGSSSDCRASVQQSNLQTEMKEMEAQLEPSINEGATDSPGVVEQCTADERVDSQIEKESEQEMLTCNETLQNPYVSEHEVANNGECDDEDEWDGTQKQLMSEPVFEDDGVHTSIDIHQSPDKGDRDVADDRVDAQEMESELEPSTSTDPCQSPAMVDYDVEPNRVDTQKELEFKLEPSTGDDLAMGENDVKDDVVSAQDDLAKHDEASNGKNILKGLAIDGREAAEDEVDVEKELTPVQEPLTSNVKLAKELEFGLVPSSGNDVLDIPVLGEYGGQDGCANDPKECESDSKPSTADNMLENPVLSSDNVEVEGVNANKEVESEPKPSTGNDLSSTPVLGIDDVIKGLESEPKPSNGDDASDTFVLAKDEVIKELESEPKPSTGNDVSGAPVLGKDDVIKELESEPKPSTGNDVSDTPVFSKDDVFKKLESEPKPSTGNDVSDTPVLGKDDVIKEFESDSETSTAGNVLEIPVSGRDVEDEYVKAIGDLESEPKPSTGNDVCDPPALGKDDVEHDGFNVTEELESDSDPSSDNIPEVPVLRSDVEDECANGNRELESKPTPSTGNDIREIPTLGKLDVEDDKSDGQDRESQEPLTSNNSHAMDEQDTGDDAQNENTNVVPDVLIGSSKQEPEVVLNAAVDEDPHDTADGCASVGWSDPSTSQETLQPPAMSGNNFAVDGVDTQEESILNRNKDSASENSDDIDGHGNAIGVMDTTYDISSFENEPKIGETPECDEGTQSKETEHVSPDGRDFGSPCSPNSDRSNSNMSQTDDNKDTDVSVGMAGDFSLPQVENSNNLAEKVTEEYSQRSFRPMAQSTDGNTELEHQGFGMNNELRMEEAEMTIENDYALDDEKEQTVATVNKDLGGDTHMDNSPDHGVDELDFQLVGNIGAHESPVREDSSPVTYKKEEYAVDDAESDPLTSLKDDDKDEQAGDSCPFGIKYQNEERTFTEETQNTSTSEDWGNNNFDIDEYQKPVPTNRSDDVLGKSMRDDLVSDLLQTSAARASSSVEGSSGSASHLYSVTNLEKASSNVADEKSIQDVDITRANANVTIKSVDMPEEFFNWSDDSSLKAFFATPTATRISQVKDSQEDATGFAFHDVRCEDLGSRGASMHDFHHQWVNEPLRVSDFNEEAQDPTACRPGPSDDPDEMFFEDFSHQYFNDKEVDQVDDEELGGMLGKNENFVFKDDQVDEIKQYGLLSEEAGASHHNASGSVELRDIAALEGNSGHSGQFEENKETQLKKDVSESKSEIGNDFSSGKGI